jgi:hypothetical protein
MSLLHKIRPHAAVLAALAALLPTPGFAEQDAASAAAPGRISFKSDVFNPQISATDAPAMIAKAKAVGEAIIGAPALANPKGIAIDWSVRVTAQHDGLPKTDPFPARGFVLLRKIDLKRNGKPDVNGRYGGEGEGPSLKFTLNDPLAFYWGNIEGVNLATGSFALPTSAKWDAGAMTVKQNGEATVVVGRTDRAPFVILTQEQALNRLIAELVEQGIPPDSKGISNIKAELAAMAPAERAQPACQGGKEVPHHWLTACTDPGAVYRVATNPNYFDATKPRLSTQLISFRVGDAGAVGEDQDEGDRLRQALSQIDLGAVRKLLD